MKIFVFGKKSLLILTTFLGSAVKFETVIVALDTFVFLMMRLCGVPLSLPLIMIIYYDRLYNMQNGS